MIGPVKGVRGQVSFDGTFVTIHRRGFMARATTGKGEKRIPVGSVTSVQWKPAGRLVYGFIQFSLAGGIEKQSRFGRQTNDAAHDENSVTFRFGQQTAFQSLRDAIEGAIGARHAAPPPPPSQGPPAGWYAAPDGDGQQWWDGSRWTEHRQR